MGRTTRRAKRGRGAKALLAAALASVALSGEPAEADALSLDQSVAAGQPVVEHAYAWRPAAMPMMLPPGLAQRFSGLPGLLSDVAEEPAPAALAIAEAVAPVLARATRNADVSVAVRDLRTGQTLLAHEADEPRIPASNQKLLTAAVALEVLGAEYQFETEVRLIGRTLYLRGSGDPTLDADDLRAMAALVAQRVDLAQVDTLVVDDTAFTARRLGPGFPSEGMGLAHEAPSGALSVDFNTIEVRVVAQRTGERPRVEVDSAGSHVVVRNEANLGRRGTVRVSTLEVDGHTEVLVRGHMSRRARSVVVRRRVVDPGLHTGTLFAGMLAEVSQSAVLDVSRGVMSDDGDLVLLNASAPLSEVLERGLAYSNNFIAEQLLRTLAWRVFEEPGAWPGGQEVLAAYWAALGQPEDGLVVENGSGLTRRGRLTAGGLVDLLTVAAAEPSEGLLDALPGAGEPGTMRVRLRSLRGHVRAKTGTLNGVSGLSGVLTAEDGTPRVAFSVLVNAHNPSRMPAAARRRVEDRIVLAVADAVDLD